MKTVQLQIKSIKNDSEVGYSTKQSENQFNFYFQCKSQSYHQLVIPLSFVPHQFVLCQHVDIFQKMHMHVTSQH